MLINFYTLHLTGLVKFRLIQSHTVYWMAYKHQLLLFIHSSTANQLS